MTRPIILISLLINCNDFQKTLICYNLVKEKPIVCLYSVKSPILMKLHIRVQETTSYKYSTHNFGLGYVPVIWHNWAKKGANMGMAVPQVLVGGWGSGPPPPNVWSRVLVCWSTAISESSFTKN